MMAGVATLRNDVHVVGKSALVKWVEDVHVDCRSHVFELTAITDRLAHDLH